MWMKALALLFLTASAAAQQHKIGVAKYELPKYPPIARAARVEGSVQMELRVAFGGAVKQVTVIAGHPLLKAAAVDTVKSWRFTCMDCKYGEDFVHRLSFTFAIDPSIVSDARITFCEFQFPSAIKITIPSPPVVETAEPRRGSPSVAARPWPLWPSEPASTPRPVSQQ